MKFAAAVVANWTGIFALCCSNASAQAAAAPGTDQPTAKSASPATDWSAAVEDAKKSFHPISAATLAEARKNLDTLLDGFEKWLAIDPAGAPVWKGYLHWSQLREELNRGEKAQPQTIREAALRFMGPDEGFESRHFAEVRTALTWYASLVTAVQGGNDGRVWFDDQLKMLAESLPKLQQHWDQALADKVGAGLGQLQDAGEAPEFLARAWGEFDRRNFLVGASASFIRAVGTPPPADQPDVKPLTDEILGTHIVGTTSTTRTQTTRLANSSDHVAMVIDVTGTANSTTTGYHHPVTIFSTGVTPFSGSMMVTMDASGYQHGCPVATACVHTTINGLCIDGGRLVQRIATKRVYSSKSEAECIASEHAQARVVQQMKENGDDPETGIPAMDAKYKKNLRNPLLRWGAFPQDTQCSSDLNHLSVVARESNRYQLAAPSPPMEVQGTPEMWVSVHQSFINNIATTTLAGRTISEFEMKNAYKSILGTTADLERDLGKAAKEAGEKPSKLTNADDEAIQKLRKITFAKVQPFSVRFEKRDGAPQYEIKFRATRFWRPKVELENPAADEKSDQEGTTPVPGMVVTARYRIEKAPEGFQGTRVEFTVEPSEEGQAEFAERARRGELGPLKNLALQQITNESKKKTTEYFGRMLPPVMKFKGLNFDPKSPLARAGTMVASDLSTDEGWLAIGWNRAAASNAAVVR